MIRDEFKDADKKVIAKKTNKKMLQMGERAYYAKKLSTINELLKPVKTTTIFCTVCFVLLAVLYIVPFFLPEGDAGPYKLQWGGITILVVTALLIVWTVVWFAFYAPYLRKKAVFYKEEMLRMNREYVMKNTRR